MHAYSNSKYLNGGKADEENSTGRRNTGGCKPLEGSMGIEEPLRLSGGFYQNYCNISVTNRKIRKKKRQTWAGVLAQELGHLPETEKEWLQAFNLTGVLPPKKFTKLRNRLWDYDHCIELQDLSDPVGENSLGEPYKCPTPSAMAYDLFKALRVWEWFDRSYLSRWEGFQYNNDGFPKNPGRSVLLISRRFGWDLADELKPRFGIILNLRPTREDSRQK